MGETSRPAIVLHTSWRGRFLAVAAPSVLLALGGYGLAEGGARLLALALFVAGAVLAVVALADYPRFTVIGVQGVERHCVARVEHLEWDRVVAIARPGLRAMGSYRARFEGGTHGGGKGGLVAEVGRRPFLLVDRVESRAEHDALLASLAVWAPGCPMRASRPAPSIPPTWLHKKRRGPASDGLVDLLA